MNYSGLQGTHLHCRCFPFLYRSPSIPPLSGFLSLSVSRAREWPCLGVSRYILGFMEEKLCPCKAGDYLPFPTKPRFNGHCGEETNKTEVRTHAHPLEGLGNIMSMSYSIRTFSVRKKAHLISKHVNATGNKQYKIERKRKK